MSATFAEIYRYLPPHLGERIRVELTASGINETMAVGMKKPFPTELRVRSRKRASVTLSDGRNIPLAVVCTAQEFSSVIARLTENSMHTHAATIKQGYIKLRGGCRAGLCGRASCEQTADGRGDTVIRGIGEITSVNIRIAHRVRGAADGIYDRLRASNFSGGVLFYGAPCSGKTTLLRDIAIRAASGDDPLRVAVIDTRGEFRDDEAMADTIIDLLEGYPKAEGIEQATRTLSPQLLICDEIGGKPEAEAILAAQNSGVPLVASAHADSLASLLRRPPIKLLHDGKVFEKYIGVTRDDGAPGGLRFNIEEPTVTVLRAV